jgi:hypothetical protein
MLQIAKNVREAARVNFALFVIVGILGVGIWPAIYLIKRTKKINDALGAEVIASWIPVTVLILLIISLVCRFFGSSDDIVGLGELLALVNGVIYIVMAFKAKRAIESVVIDQWGIASYKLNVVYTFFFTIFYVVYCLNDLDTVVTRSGRADLPVAAHA